MSRLIIANCTIVTPEGSQVRRGEEMKKIKVQKDSFVLIDNGTILVTGTMGDLEALGLAGTAEWFDAKGRVLMPGFVDSHTHLIFAGFRPDEFSWRLKGDTYMSIMERGGGIQSTVNATREADLDTLVARASWLIDSMIEMGVTAVEAKTGYGLDTDTELRMLEAIEAVREKYKDKIDITATFLGAHAVPKEYAGRTGEYCDLIINEMIPKVKDRADFFDIFTEKNVFEIEDSRRLLQAAKDAGMKLKLHADEIVPLGGADLAAEMGAVSADHLLHISDKGIQMMAESGTVATLLPLTAFALKEPYAPARKMIDSGCAVALATDLNPGSCFSGSIPLTIALACIYMGMSIEEVITALTINGAAAVGKADTMGTVEPGKMANLLLLDFDNFHTLPYYVGMNCVNTTFYKGKVVNTNEYKI